MTSKQKYFVIGENKTATSTIHRLFLSNNIPSYHGGEWPWQDSEFDAFSDGNIGPDLSVSSIISHGYLDVYPDAIFILNVRPFFDWVYSRLRHGKRYKQEWAWPGTINKCKHWISLLEAHHRNVLTFFKDKPQQLIVVDISEPKWIQFLCEELGLGAVDLHCHASKRIHGEAKMKSMATAAFKELGYSDKQDDSIIGDARTLVHNYRNNLIKIK
jgi:hypothetical protein